MVQHLQAERVRLANEVSALEQNNESLKAQLAKTKEKAQQKEQVRLLVVCVVIEINAMSFELCFLTTRFWS